MFLAKTTQTASITCFMDEGGTTGLRKAHSHASGQATTLAAEQWVEQHVPAGDVVAVNDCMRVDLKTHCKAYPLWVWKIDLDPWVMTHVLPHG